MRKTGVTDSVTAMDEDSRKTVLDIIVVFAKKASLKVEELCHEFVDLIGVLVVRVVRLLEEILCRILNCLHIN
jgi:hypothetical protein